VLLATQVLDLTSQVAVAAATLAARNFRQRGGAAYRLPGA
jgi:hypothetical protein